LRRRPKIEHLGIDRFLTGIEDAEREAASMRFTRLTA